MTIYCLTAKAVQEIAETERRRFISVPEAAKIARCTEATIWTHIYNDAISWRHDRRGLTVVDREDITLRMANGAIR